MARKPACQAGLVVELDSAKASIGTISLGLMATAPTTGAVVWGRTQPPVGSRAAGWWLGSVSRAAPSPRAAGRLRGLRGRLRSTVPAISAFHGRRSLRPVAATLSAAGSV